MISEFSELRRKMVDNQIRTVDVTDLRVLSAFLDVPREMFVPEAGQDLAYVDREVLLNSKDFSKEDVKSLEEEEAPQRALMAPAPLAKLIQLASFSSHDHVLIIGAATGYSAALISHLAGEVYALESNKLYANFAKKLLQKKGYENIHNVSGPLVKGYKAAAPYDVIFVEGACEVIPQALFEQLKDHARLVIVEGNGCYGQAALYIKENGQVTGRKVFNLNARVLPGFEKKEGFSL